MHLLTALAFLLLPGAPDAPDPPACALVGALPQAALRADDPALAEGNPPLTQSASDTWARLMEFAFDTTLSAEQKTALRDGLIALWPRPAGAARDQVAGGADAWAQISQTTGPRRELMRLSLREEIVTAAEADRDQPANKFVLELWNARSPVLVPGDPPLRRNSVQGLSSLVEWLVSKTLDQSVQLTEADKDELAQRLEREYPQAAPGDRTLLAGAETVLPWLQLEWEQASPEARARFAANLSGLLGAPRSFLPAPYAGETEEWRHPDGFFALSYPKDWSARYGALAEPVTVADWAFADVTVLGEAPTEALDFGALPTAGALVSVAAVPPAVRDGKLALGDALTRLSSELLARTGQAEPVAGSAAPGSAILSWRQTEPAATYVVWVSAVLLPESPGAAVVTIARAPTATEAQFAPAFSRIIHSLRLGKSAQPAPTPEAPNADQAARDLLSQPLGKQMDLVEGLTTGVR